jgi:hypothetical protein
MKARCEPAYISLARGAEAGQRKGHESTSARWHDQPRRGDGTLRSWRSRRSPFVHVNPPSRMPRSLIDVAESMKASTTRFWVAVSPTSPNVSPNGWAMNSERDGLMMAVISATWVREIVLNP